MAKKRQSLKKGHFHTYTQPEPEFLRTCGFRQVTSPKGTWPQLLFLLWTIQIDFTCVYVPPLPSCIAYPIYNIMMKFDCGSVRKINNEQMNG